MLHPFLLAEWHIMLHCVAPLLLKCMICLPVKEMEATFEMSYFTTRKVYRKSQNFQGKTNLLPVGWHTHWSMCVPNLKCPASSLPEI